MVAPPKVELTPTPPIEVPVVVIDAGVVDAGVEVEVVDAGVAAAPDKKPTPAKPVVLSTPLISSVIRKNAGPVVRCFQEHRGDLPGTSGKVDVTITIDRSGKVREVSSAVSNTEVGRCLEARLKQFIATAKRKP